jgi:hypothetical protein
VLVYGGVVTEAPPTEEERMEFFIQEYRYGKLGDVMDLIKMDPERGIVTDVVGTEAQARVWALTYSKNNFPHQYNVERLDGSEITVVSRYVDGERIG